MRRELVPDEVIDRCRSVRWFAAPDVSSPLKGRLFLFYQDVQVRVVPYGGRTYERSAFHVRSEPGTRAAADRVVSAVAPCTDTPGGDLQADVCDFVSNETVRLLLYGRVVHEVVTSETGQRYFFPLPNGRLFFLGKRVGQIVPPNPFEKSPRRIVWLDRRDLWVVKLPAELGGIGLAWLRHVLRTANSIPPAWSLPSIEQPTNPFDLMEFVYKSDVAVARAVRHWGWPVPNPAQRQMTNYHHLREHLRFSITMARIREHLVAELNRQLAKPDDPVTVAIEGLPNSADLKTMFTRFMNGEVSFSEAIGLTNW